jgi:hypothetical protein
MSEFDYVIEVKKRSRAPADFPDDEYTLGRFYITKEFVTDIISEKLLIEVLGNRIVKILKET